MLVMSSRWVKKDGKTEQTQIWFQAAREAGAEEVAPGAPGGARGSGGTRCCIYPPLFGLLLTNLVLFVSHHQPKASPFLSLTFDFRAFQGGGFKLGSDTVASAAVSAEN